MLYNATIEQVAAMRINLVSAIDERARAEMSLAQSAINYDAKTQKNLNSKLSFLKGMQNLCARIDAFTLGFLATHPRAFSEIFTSHRGAGRSAMFNVYAMRKVLILARVLNGGSIDDTRGGDNLTIAAVILAMAKGETKQKMLANAIDMLAHRSGNLTYNSGATQASSTLRAAESLGIVAKRDGGWYPDGVALFERAAEGCGGIRSQSVSAALDDATQMYSGSATENDRGVARIIPASAASVPDDVPGDTPDTVPQEAEAPPVSVPAAEKRKRKGSAGKGGKGKGKVSNAPMPRDDSHGVTMENDTLHTVPCDDVHIMAVNMQHDDDIAPAMIKSGSGSDTLPEDVTMF